MYRAVSVIYNMKLIFDVQNFSWVRFYGLLNHVLPFPLKMLVQLTRTFAFLHEGVGRCKWLDQCLYFGPFFATILLF